MRITLNITPYSIKQLVQLLERGCLRETYTKTFKNLKSLNRDFIKKRFNKRSHPSKRRMKLIANRIFFKANVEKSIWSLVPLKIWSSLSEEIKANISHSNFNEYISTWYESKCNRNYCKYQGIHITIHEIKKHLRQFEGRRGWNNAVLCIHVGNYNW